MKNNKSFLLDNSKRYIIGSELNLNDFVFMHKAQIRSLIHDDKALNLGVEMFDKLGSALLGSIFGVIVTINKISNIHSLWVLIGILGLASLIYSTYAKSHRNAKIDEFAAEALKEI